MLVFGKFLLFAKTIEIIDMRVGNKPLFSSLFFWIESR